MNDSSRKRREDKKASRTSHSSMDGAVATTAITATTTMNTSTTCNSTSTSQPGAYQATVAASHRLKENRRARRDPSPAPSSAMLSHAEMSTGTTTTTARSIIQSKERDRSSKKKNASRHNIGSKRTAKGSRKSNQQQQQQQQQQNQTELLLSTTGPSSMSSTVVPGPTFLERQENREVIQPGAQAIRGQHHQLMVRGEEGYSFTTTTTTTTTPTPTTPLPPDARSTSTSLQHVPRDGLTIDGGDQILTEAEMVEDPVYALEAVNMEEEKMLESKRRRQYAMWGFLAAVVVGITIAVIVVVIVIPMTQPTPAPPTPAPTFTDTTMVDFLMELSNKDDFANAASPQARALEWIVDESLSSRSLSNAELKQRYTMAVLYYATLGDVEWDTNRSWLSPDHSICEWTQSGTNVCVDDKALLREFTMDRNNMQGTLPTEIAHLGDTLQVLDITLNGVGGTIPTQIGTMVLLETLHLSLNNMVGTVPTELGQLTKVRQLYVDGNDIGDAMPNQVCELKDISTGGGALEKLWADCQIEGSNITAKIECDCCKCCPGDVPCN